MTITEFLEARIAEDEEEAREFQHDEDEVWETAGWWNPTRVLAECEAKRHLIRWVNRWPMRPAPPSSVDGVLEMLAAVYADHPDYRQEWVLDTPSQS